MYHPFSVTETLNIAWQIFKKNFATIAVYGLVAVVLVGVVGFVVEFFIVDIILEWIAVFILLLTYSFAYLGFVKLIFLFIDKEYYEFEFRDIIPPLKTLGSYLVLLILVSTFGVFATKYIDNLDEGLLQTILKGISAVGFVSFIVFFLPIAACFIVDDKSGPFESVIQSFQLVKGNVLKYFLLFLVIEGMVFIAALTILGMVFVVPFVDILLVVAYRKLVYSHIDADDEIAETV
jgi:uncharacterized membrane protein